MLSDRRGLLLVDVAGRGRGCRVFMCVGMRELHEEGMEDRVSVFWLFCFFVTLIEAVCSTVPRFKNAALCNVLSSLLIFCMTCGLGFRTPASIAAALRKQQTRKPDSCSKKINKSTLKI